MESQKIKEVVGNLDHRPMFEERRWGSYRVLDQMVFDDGTHNVTKHINIQTGKNLSYHRHQHCEKVWTIVKGEGNIV